MGKNENKKEAILRESFKLFLARGYDAVSLTDIERAANATRGAIFHHFENKEGLFRQIADRFVFAFLETVEYGTAHLQSSTPLKAFLDKCLSIIETRMEYFQQSNSEVTPASFMAFILYLKDHYDAWSEKVQEYEEQKKRSWIEVIHLSKERGEIRPDTDTYLLADTFHYLYLGLSYKGAATDKLSIPSLKKLWQYIYQQQLRR